MTGRAPMLAVESLWVRFGPVLALRNVSLEVYPGEAAALVGANGSGKTTLLRVLAGLERPALGRARVGALDSWRDRSAVWRELELITREERLPDAFDAYGCVRLFSPEAAEEEVERRIRRALAPGALDLDQEHRRVRIEQLSAGMRKKVLLATIGDKPALLLDEPTEELDPCVARRFQEESRRGGRTVLTVTHDLAEAQAADRVFVLRDGALRGFGPPPLLCRWLGVPTFDAAYDRLTEARASLQVGLAAVRVAESVATGSFAGAVGRGRAPGDEVLVGRVLLRRAPVEGGPAAPAGSPPMLLVSEADGAALGLAPGEAGRRSVCWPGP